MYVIEIINSRNKCWVDSDEYGDPPRTLNLKSAQTFENKKRANDRIKQVKETHPFRTIVYKVRKVSVS